MEKRIIYFAGYQGFKSNKFELIQKHFNACECVQFNQSMDFYEDIENIKILIENKDIYIIASSMGCLSALHTHFKYGFPIALINPSFFPDQTLKDALSVKEIENIIRFRNTIIEIKTGKEINLFTADDDERVNHKHFTDIFKDNIRYEDRSIIGGHSYSILSQKLRCISVCLFRYKIDWEDYFSLEQDNMLFQVDDARQSFVELFQGENND